MVLCFLQHNSAERCLFVSKHYIWRLIGTRHCAWPVAEDGGGEDGDERNCLPLGNFLLGEGDIAQAWIAYPSEKHQERCLVREDVKGLPFWVHSVLSPFPDHTMLTPKSALSCVSLGGEYLCIFQRPACHY